MQALAERGGQARLLILATARPEFRPSWSLRSHHSVISLGPLGRADGGRACSTPCAVGGDDRRHGVNRAYRRGVPLFVEEVTRLLLENGEQVGAHAIPPTLQQSLAARLDRLGVAREAAQIAAVLGRDFTYTLLRAVGGVDDPALQSTLDRLADAGLLIAEGLPPANYRFKHALIQDAAYDRSLLKSRRQALHRRAGEILLGQKDDAGTGAARKFLRVTSRKVGSMNLRLNGGDGRAMRRCAARPTRKRWRISARRSRWRREGGKRSCGGG